jgi:hypothetical protein
MKDIKKEIENLKTRIQELENKIAEPVKWSPVGGDWFIDDEGIVFHSPSTQGMKEFGHERPINEQAERAAVEMRRFNRLLALRDELCGDAVRHVYELSFDTEDKKWVVSDIGCFKGVSVGFEYENHAQRACDMLNSGEVEL